MLNILAELIALVNYAKSYYALVVGLLEKVALTNIKLIYVAIFSSCNKEYIFETIERALKLHGRIQVYWLAPQIPTQLLAKKVRGKFSNM